MGRITVRFSEEFSESKTAKIVYGLLKKRGLEPVKVLATYLPPDKLGEVEYFFENKTILPRESELEEILVGTKFASVEVFGLTGAAG
ncbi:MAG: hypothetical protein AABX79_02290 [Nanoarchaeota archaeon]